MFESISNAVSAATGLLEAKAQLVVHDLERAGTGLIVKAAFALVILAGAGLLVAAITLLIAVELGSPAALAIVGGLLCFAGAIGLWRMASPSSKAHKQGREGLTGVDHVPTREELKRRALKADVELREALSPKDDSKRGSDGGASPSSDASILPGWIRTAVENPEAVASGAFALLSVLGPGRVVRTISKAASFAAIAASLKKVITEASEKTHQNGTAGVNGQTSTTSVSSGTH